MGKGKRYGKKKKLFEAEKRGQDFYEYHSGSR